MDRIDELMGRLDAQRTALSLLVAQLAHKRTINRTQWEADTLAIVDELPNNNDALDEVTLLFALVGVFTDSYRDHSSGKGQSA